jgi:hypothetical protein
VEPAPVEVVGGHLRPALLSSGMLADDEGGCDIGDDATFPSPTPAASASPLQTANQLDSVPIAAGLGEPQENKPSDMLRFSSTPQEDQNNLSVFSFSPSALNALQPGGERNHAASLESESDKKHLIDTSFRVEEHPPLHPPEARTDFTLGASPRASVFEFQSMQPSFNFAGQQRSAVGLSTSVASPGLDELRRQSRVPKERVAGLVGAGIRSSLTGLAQEDGLTPYMQSNSTLRLSVNSASSPEDRRRHQSGGAIKIDCGSGIPQYRAPAEPASPIVTTQGPLPRAFNSLSFLAPRIGQDRIEIKKRLRGGYIDIALGVSVYYPTPQERRLAREHELQHEARSRQVLCPGKGLLWSHPSGQEGLPCPLEVLEGSYSREPPFSNNPPWYADTACRRQTLQFFLSMQQFLPSLIAELTDADRLSSSAVEIGILMTQEFVSASHRDTCRHPRIRILLTQLLVLLTDTLVLLEEPERFMLEFSKVNEAESIDLIGDVSLLPTISSDGTPSQEWKMYFQTLKAHQVAQLLYVLLMIENCIWRGTVVGGLPS